MYQQYCLHQHNVPIQRLVLLRQSTSYMVRNDGDFLQLKQPEALRCLKTEGAFSNFAPKVLNFLPESLRQMANLLRHSKVF